MNLEYMKKPIQYQISEKRMSPWLGLEPTKMRQDLKNSMSLKARVPGKYSLIWMRL